VLLCATIGCLLIVAACAAPGPTATSSPVPEALSERMHDKTAEVFDAVYGEDAVRAVLVQQHGEPVYTQYWNSTPDDTWDTRGVTRTVVSTLVGIAIDRGLISGVDAPLGELLPAYAAVLTPGVAGIQLKSVLTSSANFAATSEEPELGGSPILRGVPDWIGAILEDRGARGPGDGTFVSSEVGAHILAAVVAEATGMSPLRFARQSLFDPLGIESEPLWEQRFTPDGDPEQLLRAFETADVAWPADPQGVNLGYTYLRLRPTDLVQFGQLFLDEGEHDGEQIVSPTWAVEATSPVVATIGYGTISYGYQWWVDRERGVYFAQGQGGTAVVVDPRRDAVAVVASEVAVDDERATHGFAASTAVELAVALLGDLPDDSG
jgi:CubicO group peptidase (beta-lactamase class C family)